MIALCRSSALHVTVGYAVFGLYTIKKCEYLNRCCAHIESPGPWYPFCTDALGVMHMLLEIGEDLLLLQFVRSYIIAMVTVISLPLVHCYQLSHVHLSLVLALFFSLM